MICGERSGRHSRGNTKRSCGRALSRGLSRLHGHRSKKCYQRRVLNGTGQLLRKGRVHLSLSHQSRINIKFAVKMGEHSRVEARRSPLHESELHYRGECSDDSLPRTSSFNDVVDEDIRIRMVNRKAEAKPRILHRVVGTASMLAVMAVALGCMGWTLQPKQATRSLRRAEPLKNSPRLLKLVDEVKSSSASGDKYLTLRLAGDRLDLLQRSIDKHAPCQAITEIQVDWRGRQKLPRSLLSHVSDKVRPFGSVSSNGVLVLDESVTLSCREIERAFSEWKDDSSRLVGFSGLHTYIESFLLLSSKAMVCHKQYLDLFDDNAEFVDTCSNLIFSARVSAVTGSSPAVVAAKPRVMKSVNVMFDKYGCLSQLLEAMEASELPKSDSEITYIGRGNEAVGRSLAR